MALPNFVIAGPPKGGTTSIFRYLASHPDVCPSSIKEIHFFEKNLETINDSTLASYAEFFSLAKDEKIVMEASPRYMQGGVPIADAIAQVLPNTKIAFILREPVERFLSRYLSLITKTERISEDHLNLDKLVDEALANPQAKVDVTQFSPTDEIVEYLWQGAYAPYIAEYLARFPKEQLGLFYFDELKHQPREFMNGVCTFLDIDSAFFEDYQFSIENKSRSVRFPALHKLAERTNRRLELVQNKFPAIRRTIKKTYYALLNPETDAIAQIDTSYAAEKLGEYYSQYNSDLHEIMKEYSADDSNMPPWLSAKKAS
jgi:hypothetical protein